jgi:hypothetical protein
LNEAWNRERIADTARGQGRSPANRWIFMLEERGKGAVSERAGVLEHEYPGQYLHAGQGVLKIAASLRRARGAGQGHGAHEPDRQPGDSPHQ